MDPLCISPCLYSVEHMTFSKGMWIHTIRHSTHFLRTSIPQAFFGEKSESETNHVEQTQPAQGTNGKALRIPFKTPQDPAFHCGLRLRLKSSIRTDPEHIEKSPEPFTMSPDVRHGRPNRNHLFKPPSKAPDDRMSSPWHSFQEEFLQLQVGLRRRAPGILHDHVRLVMLRRRSWTCASEQSQSKSAKVT